jgi:hypothetical protein
MSVLITTCPNCGRACEVDPQAQWTTCRCGTSYNVWENMDEADDGPEPDYGGAFDGFTVTSDADPGL